MTKQSALGGWVVGFSVMVVLVGCVGTELMPAGKSLCDWLGGKSSVSSVVDQFVANVAADIRINVLFAITEIRKLKGHLVDQVCMATGGPCSYSGRDMKTTHARMKLSKFRGDYEARGRTAPSPLIIIRERLDGVMGGDEECSEVPEPLKVGPAAFVKLVGQVIQIGDTIFDDPEPLGIKPFRAIEEIHHASADYRIQCHQRPLMLASHSRPPLLLVGFP